MKFMLYVYILFNLSYGQFNWQNDGASIRQGLHIEWQRTGDANSDGSMIYAWSDCRSGVRDVIVQKVDVNGNNLWGEYGVVAVNSSGRQEDPQLVTDGNGGAYIIWMDYKDESDAEGDVYAQHVLSDGSLGWASTGIALTNRPGKQASPNICSDGQGGAYVIWKDSASSSYGDVYATHLSSSGALAPGDGIPIITYSSYRSSPSLNTAGSGEAVLVWSDDRNSNEDLYAQRISVSGSSITTEWGNGGILVSNASGDQTSPRVSSFNGESTIIVWEDARDGYTDVYYQILDGSGNSTLSNNGVSACTGEWEVIKPRVKADNGVAYIVWEDRRNGFTSDIYAQKISSSGGIEWDNGLVISIADGSQAQPRLTTDGNGGSYFVWEDSRNSDVSGVDIYAQHVSSSGSVTHSENGILISNADNLQFNPLVRDDGAGGSLIVWGDQRSGGSYGIYIQRLQNSGTSLTANGKESFFGISTDAANEPYEHGAVYLENNEALVYWQDNRFGESKIYGTKISSSFDGSGGDYFSNSSINGQPLTSLDLAQEIPKVILAGDKIFLSFKVEESPNENLYFQLLNLDLSAYGSAVAVADPSTSKQGFDMVYGEDGNIYYAYSEDYDITVKKISSSGSVDWTVQAVSNSADDIVKAVYAYPGSGCLILYESQSFIEGSHIYAVALNSSGEVLSGWPVSISNLTEDQYYESSVSTNDGIFVSFKDNSSNNYDVYGQLISFNGSLEFPSSGLAISSGAGDQQSSSSAYDNTRDKVLVCYENPDGSETDVYCNELTLADQSIGDDIVLSGNNDNQKNPYVYWSGHSFMISWEDSRLNSESNLGEDIFFQEYKGGSFVLPDGGQSLTVFDMKQERPIITKYSDSDDEYLIVWEDYRSTGKEFCANLYGQSYTSVGCPSLGDLNGDGGFNVLDIVGLANCVLANNCSDLGNGCAGDMNGDGGYNVLDIVALANCVLANNCGGRVDDATASSLSITDKLVSIEADGFIGGVQMTINHGDDFTIDMTDRALFADYLTTDNQTRLLVINPETEDLFTYDGQFEIVDIMVANTQYEVSVELPLAASFSLSEAYPNPFNPTTAMTLTMPIAGDVNVEVYNVRGQVVATLASGYMDANTYTLSWDATDASSGLYFVKATAEGFTKTQKLMLLK
jgi:hypothetical protein